MKSKHRKHMLEHRRSLSADESLSYSFAIKQKLQRIKSVSDAKCIMAYFPHKGEVDLHEFIAWCMAMGKRMALPCVKQKGIMIAVEYTENCDLKPNRYGIKEPLSKKEIAQKDIDVIIVPALAFDKSLHRLGFGGGYYDRYLASTKAAKIGVGFDFQIVEQITRHPHDIPVDMIVTQTRTIGAAQ